MTWISSSTPTTGQQKNPFRMLLGRLGGGYCGSGSRSYLGNTTTTASLQQRHFGGVEAPSMARSRTCYISWLTQRCMVTGRAKTTPVLTLSLLAATTATMVAVATNQINEMATTTTMEAMNESSSRAELLKRRVSETQRLDQRIFLAFCLCMCIRPSLILLLLCLYVFLY